MVFRSVLPLLADGGIDTTSATGKHIECRDCGKNLPTDAEECPDCGGGVAVYTLS
jgi:rRNA maturation endonuclease Nob1